jgi:hypothetical protein
VKVDTYSCQNENTPLINITAMNEVAYEQSGPYARQLYSVNEKHARDAIW